MTIYERRSPSSVWYCVSTFNTDKVKVRYHHDTKDMLIEFITYLNLGVKRK